jgi:transposase
MIQAVCRGRRPADMSKALSLDLRVRVLAAVEAGASHREAGERFGVSAASVSRWRRLAREQGEPRPGPLGGDRRSARIEAQAPLILALVDAKPDITLVEIKAGLAEQGVPVGIGTLWRFFRRHAITLKKSRRMPLSRAARTS